MPRIGRVMWNRAANERQHKQRPAHLCRFMRTSAGQYHHRATTCTINQDLWDLKLKDHPYWCGVCISLIRCLQWTTFIRSGFFQMANPLSGVECANVPCPTYNINQRQHTSSVACSHQVREVSHWHAALTRPAHMEVECAYLQRDVYQ